MIANGLGLRLEFTEDLGFFLARGLAKPVFFDLSRRASVKDLIESLGVPHTEVGEIRFRGRAVGFDFIPAQPGALWVSGVKPPLDVLAASLLRPFSLSGVSFVADLNVHKLGRYLLFLGYDTVLAQTLSDREIADLAVREGRIVLTRDTRLLFRRKIDFARRIRSVYPLDQLDETLDYFGLVPDPEDFFTRCVSCNRALESVEKSAVDHLLEPKTRKYVHRFRQCPGCRQVFWQGSHYDALQVRLRARGVIN